MYLWADGVSDEVKAKFAKTVKCPVVYMFLDNKDNVLYVGKTTYFLADGRSMLEARSQ